MNDVDKFNYLNSLLEEKAQMAFVGLSITGENYKIAVKLLHERFGDLRNIINAHMDALVSLPEVKSENVQELREV